MTRLIKIESFYLLSSIFIRVKNRFFIGKNTLVNHFFNLFILLKRKLFVSVLWSHQIGSRKIGKTKFVQDHFFIWPISPLNRNCQTCIRGITSDHQNFQASESLLKIYHTDLQCLPQTRLIILIRPWVV